MKKLVLSLIAVLFLSGLAAADPIQIDPDRLSPESVKKLYELKKAAEDIKAPVIETLKVTTPDQVEKWANLGQGIAKAIGATCKELNVEVNAFVQTPVGRMAMFMIVYKIIGVSIIKTVAVTIAWITILIMSWSTYKRLFGTERIEKDGVIKYVPKYEFHTNDARSCAAAFNVIIPVVFTILWVIVV
jgi:hypothetical protein